MTGSAQSTESARTGKGLQLALATSASVMAFWAWNIVAPLGARYTQEMGLNPTATAVLVAMPMFVGSLGRIVVGAMADRFGGRVMFTFVLLGSGPPVLLVALGGTLGYIYNGWGHPGLPEWSLGFVYLPAFVWLVPSSMLMAPFGARMAHRLPVSTLKRIFACVLIALAAKMLWGQFS